MKTRIRVGVAGVSEEPHSGVVKNIDLFLDSISRNNLNPIFYLGGYWGFMKHFADKALEKRFTVVFILPDGAEASPPDREGCVIIETGLDSATRSHILCKSSEVLVVFGGRIGSMIEVMLAYNYYKPVVIIESGYETDRLAQAFGETLDARRRSTLHYVKDGAEATKKILEILGKERASYIT